MKTIITILLILFFLTKASFAQLFTEQTDIVIPGINEGSVDWGDYNNDGLLDFMIVGYTGEGFMDYSAIYRNTGNSSFVEVVSTLERVQKSDLCWGDYNNDNYLDILIMGIHYEPNVSYNFTAVYKNEMNESFNELLNTGISKTSSGCVAWGDYSNDAYNDIFQSGYNQGDFITKIYRNNQNGFFLTNTNITIPGVLNGSIDWGDCNNDGYLDFVFTGNYFSDRVTKVYMNNGDGSFLQQGEIELTNVSAGSVQWGDYNNDSFLDIIISGQPVDNSRITKIYKNNGNQTFSEINDLNLAEVSWGNTIWGDYDNDGLLDILLSGWDATPETQTKLYKNFGNGTFVEQHNLSLESLGESDIGFGDYDNDNDLDILISGLSVDNGAYSAIYKNNTPNPNPNTPPNPITNLQTEVVGTDVYFSWDEATDNNQPSAGLNYNIYAYNEDNRESILAGDTAYEHQFIASPQAFIYNHPLNGKRLLAQRGHIQGIRENGRVTYMLKGILERCQTYYWSVQAIDASFAGGEFAPEDSFYVDNIPPYIVCPLDKEFDIDESQTGYLVNDLEIDPIYVADACGSFELENNINFTETMLGEELPPGITTLVWTATDSVGNVSQCSFDVEITQVISVNDIYANKITISPNPSNGIFSIKNASELPISELQLSITDITGKIILTRRHAPLHIDISNQPKGIYFLRLSHEDFVQTFKVIVY